MTEKTELQRLLDAAEANLSRLQVSGLAAVYMGEALKALYKARELARPSEKEGTDDG